MQAVLLRKCDTYIGVLLLPTFVLGKFVRPFAITHLVDSSGVSGVSEERKFLRYYFSSGKFHHR